MQECVDVFVFVSAVIKASTTLPHVCCGLLRPSCLVSRLLVFCSNTSPTADPSASERNHRSFPSRILIFVFQRMSTGAHKAAVEVSVIRSHHFHVQHGLFLHDPGLVQLSAALMSFPTENHFNSTVSVLKSAARLSDKHQNTHCLVTHVYMRLVSSDLYWYRQFKSHGNPVNMVTLLTIIVTIFSEPSI